MLQLVLETLTAVATALTVAPRYGKLGFQAYVGLSLATSTFPIAPSSLVPLTGVTSLQTPVATAQRGTPRERPRVPCYNDRWEASVRQDRVLATD